MAQGGRPGLWTPANVVTMVRVACIPVFMGLALAAQQGTGLYDPALSWAAFAVYVVLSLTDKLDGYLARSRNEVTDFGRFLDPIADKLLVFSALLLLLAQGLVGVWAVFVILAREFLVSALRMVASAKGTVIAADRLGKAKTAVTMVALCGYYLALALLSVLGGEGALVSGLLALCDALMAVAVLLTVVSGAHYLWNGRGALLGE